MLRFLFFVVIGYFLFTILRAVIRMFTSFQDQKKTVRNGSGKGRQSDVEKFRNVKDAEFTELPSDKGNEKN